MFLLALVAFLVAMYLGSRGRPGEERPATVAPAGTPTALRTENTLEESVVARASRVVELEGSGQPPTTATPDGVDGLVHVREPDGRRTLARDGTLQLELWRSGRLDERLRNETVRDGKWSCVVPADGKLVPVSFTSSNARFGRAEHLEISAADRGAACDVVVDWQVGITVHALDETTSEELADVEVRVLPSETVTLAGQPPEYSPGMIGIDERVLRGNSPLTLPCFATPMRGWARAPGRPWRSFTFAGCDGKRVVRLESGGALEVVVTDAHALPENARIAVWDCTANPSARIASARAGATGGARFEDLPARDLVVCLFGSRAETCGNVLDVVPVTVRAGTTVVAETCVDCPGSRARTATITLEITGSMQGVENLVAQSVDPLRPQLGRQHFAKSTTDANPFPRVLELGRFMPGLHRVDARPGIAVAEVTLEPGQSRRITLPGAASKRMKVRVLDRESGTALPNAAVNARLGSSREWIVFAYDREKQMHTASVGDGDVHVVASLDGFTSTARTIPDAQVGAPVELTLDRSSRYPVRLLLEESGAGVIVPADAWATGKIVPLPPCTGKELRRSFGTEGSGIDARGYMEWLVDQPGRYRICFPRFEGYEQVEDREVDFASSEGTTITVSLTPSLRPNAARSR